VRVSLKNVNLYIIAAGLVSAAAVVSFFSASDSNPVSQVAVITGIQPVIVALLSSLFIRKLEKLSWITFICSLLATIGVALLAV
jgi:drug/metabolite transporter (DMT)-like permease